MSVAGEDRREMTFQVREVSDVGRDCPREVIGRERDSRYTPLLAASYTMPPVVAGVRRAKV